MDKQSVEVLGHRMAYVERGAPDADLTVVCLHGNPTSSYLWRDVIPGLEGLGRVLAPDLVGHGDSDPIEGTGDDRYRFVEHRRYLDAWFDEVVPEGRVLLVVHDWGSGLGFDWANRNRDRVVGVAFMEAIVTTMSWDDWPEAATGIFKGLRSEKGEDMVLERNTFVERILPSSILRDLTDEEMAEYRRPFAEAGERRRPTLTWPREIPFDGEPADVHDIVSSYSTWLAGSVDLPKLFVDADPGMILTGPQRELVRTWPNLTEVTVAGLHFVQEDSGAEIGEAIATWWHDTWG